MTRPNGSGEGLAALRKSSTEHQRVQLTDPPEPGWSTSPVPPRSGANASTNGALQYVAVRTGRRRRHRPGDRRHRTDPAVATQITQADGFSLGTSPHPAR